MSRPAPIVRGIPSNNPSTTFVNASPRTGTSATPVAVFSYRAWQAFAVQRFADSIDVITCGGVQLMTYNSPQELLCLFSGARTSIPLWRRRRQTAGPYSSISVRLLLEGHALGWRPSHIRMREFPNSLRRLFCLLKLTSKNILPGSIASMPRGHLLF
jgi:hypothetical protein